MSFIVQREFRPEDCPIDELVGALLMLLRPEAVSLETTTAAPPIGSNEVVQ